jgi:hypothetical protein
MTFASAPLRQRLQHANLTGLAFSLLLVGLMVVTFVVPTPFESAAFMTALIGAGVAVVPIWFVRDPEERAILLRLFFIGYVFRIILTYILFKTDIITALGGADDLGWKGSAAQARRWNTWDPYLNAYGQPNPDKTSFADSFLGVYTDTKINSGYLYMGALFYYYLGVNSQLALAFLNCWGSALTVLAIYKTASLFASRKAAIWVSCIGLFLPGFLVWAALTQKEAWVILFQITGFYGLWQALQNRGGRRWLYAALWAFMVLMVDGFRFYVAYVQVLAAGLTILAFHAKNPVRSAAIALGGLVVVAGLAIGLGIVHLDVSSMVADQLNYVDNFRAGILSGPNSASSVQLDYDLHTWNGFLMMLVVGFLYLMFSPFVWQVSNARQAAALPDVFFWYGLLVFMVIPGAVWMWRSRRYEHGKAAVLSILFSLLPLMFVYSLSFSNVGLSFRLRVQFIPLLLVFAAAGYDRLKQLHDNREVRRKARLTRSLELILISDSHTARTPAALPSALSHEKTA